LADEQLGLLNLIIIKTPKRDNFEEIILFFERQLRKRGVDIRLGLEATAEAVLSEAPDVVVVATGSRPFRPDIPGADATHVVTSRDVLDDPGAVGERVVVVDTLGRAEAPTTAEYLAELGSRWRSSPGCT
jgi:NADPH-dependent 2,4-dienoyl-CoA reductase/sulfur reductase-like enzyme